MALKRIVNLTEGPLDFVRGAAQQIGPAVSRVAQSGRTASAEADLFKAVATLVKMLQQPVEQTPAQPAPTQAPTPRYQTAGAQQMPLQPQMTFSSFIQDAYGDHLNEGIWDFVKGAAAETGKKIGAEFRKRYAPPSVLSDIVKAGRNASQAGDDRRAAAATQSEANQIPTQVKLIQQILQRLPNAQNSLRKVIGQVAGQGDIANKVYSMIVPAAQPTTQPTPATTPPAPVNTSSARTSTQWQQGTVPATPRPAATSPTRRHRHTAVNPRRRTKPSIH